MWNEAELRVLHGVRRVEFPVTSFATESFAHPTYTESNGLTRDPGQGLAQTVWTESRRGRCGPGGPSWVLLRLPGPERRGQIDHHPHADGLDSGGRRHDRNPRLARA